MAFGKRRGGANHIACWLSGLSRRCLYSSEFVVDSGMPVMISGTDWRQSHQMALVLDDIDPAHG
jgi:hypothetical protein